MAEATRLSFEVGHLVSYTRSVTDQDVADFARLSGDTQGFHVDDSYAQQSRFGQRIAHATLAIGFISAALGTRLPSPDESVIFLSQSLKFPAPMFCGDTITTELEVRKVDHRRRWATLSALCVNQSGAAVVRGEVTIMVDRFPYRT